MKVASGENLAVLGEYERVVGHRVHLHFEPCHDVVEKVAHRTVHLRSATDAVGVLHPDVVSAVRLPNLGALHQRPHVPGAALLARMGAQGMDSRVEGGVGAAQRVGGHRADQVRGAHQATGVEDGDGEQRGHRLGAVDEREPLLRLQDQGLPADRGEALRRRHPLAPDHELAPSDQGESKVRERGEIAARTDRAPARHARQGIGIEQGKERIDHLRPHAGVAAGEGVGAKQEHAAHCGRIERRSHPRSVAQNQTLLERLQVGRCNAHPGEVPESGVDSVHRFVSFHHLLDRTPRGLHS